MMDLFQFVFWEALKVFGLVVLALLAVKALKAFAGERRRPSVLEVVLYGAIVALVIVGARAVGQDIAAEVYDRAGQRNLDRHQYAAAYANSLRAVELRPGALRYWQSLARAKFSTHQFASLLRDEPVFRALSPNGLDEDDLLRFAYSRFFLGDYREVMLAANEIIQRNPTYPKPYVLAGVAEMELGQYPDAERSFLKALQILPTQADAVEGLAHVYFLMGATDRAVAVLDATHHYAFPPEESARFQALKALYEQSGTDHFRPAP
jgi:tetratricopeptide (TPR) repeat protein